MSDLPQGWATATLNDLLGADGLFSDGDWVESKDQDPDGTNRLLQLADIGDGFFVDKSSRYVNDEKFSSLNCTELKEGDVLIARMPAPLGRACLLPAMPQRCLTVVDVAVFRVGGTGVSNKWLMHFLNSSTLRREMELNSSGTTRKRISRGKLGEILLSIPPVAEQIRIATKLDELMAQVNTLKACIDDIPKLLKRFRQSVLAAAVSGRLTEEWRGSAQLTSIRALLNEIAMERSDLKARKILKANVGRFDAVDELYPLPCASWEWVCFDQISKNDNNALKAGPFGSALKKSDCVQAGYKVYGQEQVISGDENLVTYFIDENKFKELEACRVGAEDILISLVGTIGKVLVLSKKAEIGIINPRLVKISVHPDVSKSYLKLYLDSEVAHGFFKRFSHGGTMEILNLGILRELPIPLPSIAEQTEIVRRVEQLFAFADQLETRVKATQARVNGLTQSILTKAFRGELVQQDANDEPAGVLLERIKAQRAAAPKAKRGRRPAMVG